MQCTCRRLYLVKLAVVGILPLLISVYNAPFCIFVAFFFSTVELSCLHTAPAAEKQLARYSPLWGS